jgi:phosphatidylserine decarboxylase
LTVAITGPDENGVGKQMFAKDYSAWIFTAGCFIVGLILLFGSILFSLDPYSVYGVFYIIAVLLFCIGIFLLFFMRDPERKIGEGIISPADGKVIIIDKQKNQMRIAIFMNPADVHVNRVPIAGEVIETEHHSGGYLPAYNKESDQNERFTTLLKTARGEVKIVQIAGVVVRRIVPYLEEGDKVKKGDKLGHIMMGSRVDVYLPKKKLKIKVEVGQKVKAGSTTIAE